MKRLIGTCVAFAVLGWSCPAAMAQQGAPARQQTATEADSAKYSFVVFYKANNAPTQSMMDTVKAAMPSKQQHVRAIHLLEQVGLGQRIGHKPHELSVGQQQRVALARTLANDPRVILADEPTGNLDPGSRQLVLTFLDSLNQRGRTIIMVTHDAVAAARARCRQTLKQGRIHGGETPEVMGRAA